MPKFVVTLNELVDYEVTVEAENEDAAAELAEETFLQAEDISIFPCIVHAREVANVEEMEG